MILFASLIWGPEGPLLLEGNALLAIAVAGFLCSPCFWFHLRIRFGEALEAFYALAEAADPSAPDRAPAGQGLVAEESPDKQDSAGQKDQLSP